MHDATIKIGGKVLEKVLVNRISHNIFSHNLMNNKQYGLTPQRNTIGAAMAAKDFVEKGLAAVEIIVLVSVDLQRAFDAA